MEAVRRGDRRSTPRAFVTVGFACVPDGVPDGRAGAHGRPVPTGSPSARRAPGASPVPGPAPKSQMGPTRLQGGRRPPRVPRWAMLLPGEAPVQTARMERWRRRRPRVDPRPPVYVRSLPQNGIRPEERGLLLHPHHRKPPLGPDARLPLADPTRGQLGDRTPPALGGESARSPEGGTGVDPPTDPLRPVIASRPVPRPRPPLRLGHPTGPGPGSAFSWPRRRYVFPPFGLGR